MDIELKDVRVEADELLGAPGEGFRIAMWALNGGRVAIAAQALGVGQAALEEALAYARTREAFGQPIGNYQAIQWMLADIATDLDAARMLTLKAAETMIGLGLMPLLSMKGSDRVRIGAFQSIAKPPAPLQPLRQFEYGR